MQNFRNIKVCASVKTRRRENVKFIVTNCKDRFKLQLFAYEYQKQSAEVFFQRGVLKNFAKFIEKHF